MVVPVSKDEIRTNDYNYMHTVYLYTASAHSLHYLMLAMHQRLLILKPETKILGFQGK